MSVVVSYNHLANRLEEPLPCLRIRDWQEWSWLSVSIDESDTCRFGGYRLKVLEGYHPQLLEFSKLDKDDSIVGQECDSIIPRYVEMGDIVFVEIGSFSHFLQPRLTKRFSFRERSQDSIRRDVTRKSDSLDIALIKDCRGVSDTLGRGRDKVKDTHGRLGKQSVLVSQESPLSITEDLPNDTLTHAFHESSSPVLLRSIHRLGRYTLESARHTVGESTGTCRHTI
jgi:hypothetical protein